MRQAHIGADGNFYDADEHIHSSRRGRPHVIHHRKMIENSRKRRTGKSFLGQAATPVVPPPPVQGLAYRAAARVAVPLAPVFPDMPKYSWSRDGDHPEFQVYPGSFVISDRYPDILFRVAFRPPAGNNPANTRLSVIDGQGAGTYIEVPVFSDGTDTPALMRDFKVVPIGQYVTVEYALQQYPVPQVDGGDTWKVDFYWIYNTIDQAGYMLSSISAQSDPATWATNSADTFVQIAGALGLVVDAIDLIGWAFDFGAIGEKELKIFTKIGTDIFIKATALYNRMNPSSADTVYKTSDDSKIESFQQLVDDVTVLRPYWSVMLARALIYYQQNLLMQVFISRKFYDRAIEMGSEGSGLMGVDQADLLTALAAETDQATAQTMISTLASQYQSAYQGVQANWNTFSSLWSQAGLGDYSPNSLYAYSVLYQNMLKENARNCMEIRSDIKDTIAGIDVPCIEGLGQTPGVLPTIPIPIMAGLAPGLAERKAVGSIIKNDLLKNQVQFEKNGLYLDDAVAMTRNLVKDIRTEIEKLQATAGVDSALPISSVAKPARGLERSLVEAEDPEIKAQIRDMLRGLPISPENALRQGFDRMIQDLTSAERNLDAIIYEEDGRTVKRVLSNEDLIKKAAMREQAGVDLGRAFTEAFIAIEKTPDGSEAIRNVMAQGLVTAAGEVRSDLADKILTTIMDSAIESNLFSFNALAGIGKYAANDLGLEVSQLSDYYQSRADQLQTEVNTLQYSKKIIDPVTKQEKVTFLPIDQTVKAKKMSELDGFQRLAGIFSSADSPDALVKNYTQQILSYQDVMNAATGKGQVALATFDSVAQADGLLKEAKYLIDQMNYLYNQIVGSGALPEYVAALKAPANAGLASALQNAVASLTGKMEVLKKYSGPDGQALINAQKLPLSDLTTALQGVVDAIKALGEARDPLLAVLQDANASRGQLKLATLMKTAQAIGTNAVEMAKKTSIGAVMTLVMMGPLVFGALWAVVQVIALPFGVHVGNPIVWMSNLVEGLLSLLPSPRVGDRPPTDQAKDDATWSPTTKLLMVALGISMIFYGKQLFPMVSTVFGTFQSAFKALTSLAPWAQKKKGKRGRPRGEGEPEKKLKGRGAPIDIDEAMKELDQAKNEGNKQREERIISKLKRAAERGQTVPPGLWNLNWR